MAEKLDSSAVCYLTSLASNEIASTYTAGLVHGTNYPVSGLAGQSLTRTELRLTYLMFNQKKPPFDQPGVRGAFAAALDRAAFVSRGGVDEIPAFAVVPPGLPDAVAGKDFRAVGGGMLFADRDLIQARQLLTAAGFPDGPVFPSAIWFMWAAGSVIRISPT